MASDVVGLSTEELYALLIEGVKDQVLILGLTPDGRISHWNHGAEALMGYTEEEVLGKPFDVLWLPEDRALGKPRRELAEAQRSGVTKDEHWMLRKDGTRFWASGVTTRLGSGRESGRGFAKLARDLSARKAFEEQLVARYDLLVAFLNLVAHELGNPLTTLRVQLELLRLDARPEQAGGLEVMMRNSKRLDALLKDLMDAAHLQSGTFPLVPEPFDVAELLTQSLRSLQEEAKQRGVKFDVDAPSTLPVVADRAGLRRVLVKLLRNALRFSKVGGRIRLRLHCDADHATFSVTDECEGLTPPQVGRLFDLFGKAHDQSREDSGLGLYICKGIVEAHRGTLSAACEAPGEGGCTFTLTIPLHATAGRGLPAADWAT